MLLLAWPTGSAPTTHHKLKEDPNMVSRYKTVLMDDLDNTIEAVETVRITRNGETREVDLGKRNLSRYVDKVWNQGRRTSPGNAKPNRPATAIGDAPEVKPGVVPTSNSNKVDNAAIRAWARSRGIEVTQRGRLPKSIVDQYEQFENNKTVVG